MDKARARELKRSAAATGGRPTTTTPSPAKRRQRSLSGHIISSSSVQNGSNNGRGEGVAMESCEKELRWNNRGIEENSGDGCGNSAEDDPCIFRAPPAATTTASLSSRKRVRLQAKVSEDCKPVDPAMVPRKLRSAINKRSRQSTSPPLPDSKRKQLLAPNGTQLSLVNGMRKFKQSMLPEPITKDEEEVAETLSELASLFIVSKPIKEDKRVLVDKPETKATSVSLSEASKEEGGNFFIPCKGTEVSIPSSSIEESPNKTEKAEPSIRGQPITVSRSPNFDLELNGTAQPDFPRIPTPKNEQTENPCSRNATKSLNPLTACLQHHSGNGILLSAQFDPFDAPKPEIGLWPFEFASGEGELQSFKQKHDGGAHYLCQKDTTVDVRHGFPSNGYEHSQMPFSRKDGTLPDSLIGACGPSSNGNYLPTQKLPPLPAVRKRSLKRSTTHVYISLLIRNHQNFEKRQQIACPSDPFKVKDGVHSGIQTSDEIVGSRNALTSISSGDNVPVMERNIHEARIRTLQDGRHVQTQQASMIPGTYGQQDQVCDFLSMSAISETSSPGNAVKSSGQLHRPYLHSQVPRHSMMSFPFPHVPCTSPYPDQLAAAASQQVQLQVPHYIGNPLYGQHMVHAASAIKQQQQMWQVQMAHYRPPIGNMGIPKSSNVSSQPPPIFPPPSSGIPSGPYHPPNLQQQQQQQLLPISWSSSSRAKQQQHQHRATSRFGPEDPAPLKCLAGAPCPSSAAQQPPLIKLQDQWRHPASSVITGCTLMNPLGIQSLVTK